MILTAHQPVYMPWLGTFAKIAAADKFVIFDCVPFSRHDYTNRVQIKTKDGARWLTVPVEHTGERSFLRDTRIASGNWRRKHLRAIECAYARAPHFDDYFPMLRSIIGDDKYERLAELDSHLLVELLRCLGIGTQIVYAHDYQFHGEKSSLVLNMCEQLGATEYIFGSQGRGYAEVPAFEAAGINVHFQDYQHPVYRQQHGAFVPGLSVIDLLMNCGPESGQILNSQP